MAVMASFGNDKIAAGISSVAFSKSGRLLFGGYEDHSVRAWDILADPAGSSSCAAHLVGHENRVSSLAINPQGDALLTGSWDTVLRVILSSLSSSSPHFSSDLGIAPRCITAH
jgi:guanine nucleotide-binding protein G(I)/G(S)/G(T) subunit beta-1